MTVRAVSPSQKLQAAPGVGKLQWSLLEDPSVLYVCSTFVAVLNMVNNLYSLQRTVNILGKLCIWSLCPSPVSLVAKTYLRAH